ncbi:MAG: hypothetical protein RLZZ370_1417 [Bacteroidota bacterium]|jgi:glycosyltransferase involved in cell wall biosynthesis
MMNILVVSSRIPFPLRDGGAIATFNQLKSYAALGHQVTLCSLNTRKHHVPGKTIEAELAFIRKVHTVEADTDIRVIPALRSLLEGSSYNMVRFDVPEMHTKLRELCTAEAFDLIQLEGLFTTPYISTIRASTKAPILLRQHNVEFRIWEKLAANTDIGPKRWYLNLLARRLKTYELRQLPKVDLVAAITEEDAQDMQHSCPKARIFTAPAGIALPNEITASDPLHSYHLGSMEWMPNQEGVQWLLAEVWPKVKAREPRAILHLAGKGLTRDFFQELPEGVINHGEVPDAGSWHAHFGISLVPLHAAGGIRMKTLEAMAAGKNVVSTTAGARGLPVQHLRELLIADSADAFADAILTLIHDTSLRNRLQQEGRALAARYECKYLAGQLLEQVKKMNP